MSTKKCKKVITTKKYYLLTTQTLFITLLEADPESDFWGLLACAVCDLYPVEIMDVIENAYEEGLIPPGIIGYESFKKAIADGEASGLEKINRDLTYYSLKEKSQSQKETQAGQGIPEKEPSQVNHSTGTHGHPLIIRTD